MSEFHHIAIAPDNNYVHHAIAMLHSLYKSNRNLNYYIHLLDSGLDFKNKIKLKLFLIKAKFKYKIYSIDNSKISNSPTSNHISIAAYNRLLISSLLSKEINKVLYLDCDLIILNDLLPLFEIQLNSNYLGAIEEVVNEDVKTRLEIKNNYFNSGVLLINLIQWRKLNFESELIYFLNNQKEKIVSHDQDVLNYCAKGKWLKLDYKYNVTHFFYYPEKYSHNYLNLTNDEYLDIKSNPVIIHFTSQDKPWTLESTHPKSDLYFKYILSLKEILLKKF